MKTLFNILMALSWFSALYCGTNENLYGTLISCTLTIIFTILLICVIILEQLDEIKNKQK